MWLGDCTSKELFDMPECMNCFKNVRQFRLSIKIASTLKIVEKPTHFQTENIPINRYILIPKVSSDEFLTPDILCSDLVFIIPNAELYHFDVLTSIVHMA